MGIVPNRLALTESASLRLYRSPSVGTGDGASTSIRVRAARVSGELEPLFAQAMNSPPSARPEAPLFGTAWAVAVTVIAVVTMLVGAGIFVFRSVRELPAEAARGTLRAIEELQQVAAAFRQGTIRTEFSSYATSVTGSNYLQFATLRQTEVFTRTDRSSILWGSLQLPEVVVSATAPVEYTAYLDFNEEWQFNLTDQTLEVLAPPIHFNLPAIDASQIHYEIRQDSLLRDEEESLEELKLGLTQMSIRRSRDHLPLVRETGRRKTEEFIENWLVQSFGDGRDYRVRVVFADEVEHGSRPGLRLAEDP